MKYWNKIKPLFIIAMSIIALSCASSSKNVGAPESPNLNSATDPNSDLTGEYSIVTSIVGTSTFYPWVFEGKRRFQIKLKQENNDITGRFATSGVVNGILKGNKIEVLWETRNCFHGTGEWSVSSDKSRLDGTWDCEGSDGVSGEWRAQKL